MIKTAFVTKIDETSVSIEINQVVHIKKKKKKNQILYRMLLNQLISLVFSLLIEFMK